MESNIVGIIGCGFIGMSLINCFCQGYQCIGYDINKQRIKDIEKQYCHNNVKFTSDIKHLSQCKLFLISVPTPLKNNNTEADLSYVEQSLLELENIVIKGSTIVIESSVAIGTTEKLLKKFRDKDIFCGFSPERVDPGRTSPKDNEIAKIISGLDDESLEVINKWYSKVYQKIVPVSNTRTAEMCKLYENCFRMININYVNEINDACIELDINPIEMINASATKPFGFMPFYPGLFVGGTCIGINPYYLKMTSPNIKSLYDATNNMEERPTQKAYEYLYKYHPKNVLIIGLGFKRGQTNTTGSGSFPFARTLIQNNVNVHYYDPLVESDLCPKMPLDNWTTEKLELEYDLIVVCIKQINIDYQILDNVKKIKVIDFSSGRY